VGKIYNVLSHVLAQRLCAEVPGVAEATVWLSSRIGDPIDLPAATLVKLRPRPGASLADLRPGAEALLRGQLERLADFCSELADGKHSVC
jgi:S-adenosylmethionine synthetase